MANSVMLKPPMYVGKIRNNLFTIKLAAVFACIGKVTVTERVGNEVIRFQINETTKSAVFFITDVVDHSVKFFKREAAFAPKK